MSEKNDGIWEVSLTLDATAVAGVDAAFEEAGALSVASFEIEEGGAWTMTALFEGEETASFTSEVRRAYEAFRRELLMLLTVEEPGRDQIALLLQDLSGEGNRAMPLWLSGLLDQLPARGWSLAAHIADDPRGPQEIYDRKAWPPVDKRRFGPPRPPEVLRERLAQPGGVHACVLLVRGPWAGTLLTTEAGLLRFVGCALEGDAPASRPQHLFITRLGMLSGIPWHDWDGELFKLPKPTDFHLLVKRPAVREIDANKGSVELSFKQATLELAFADYWQNIEQLALEHLLIYETSETLDRDLLFTGALGHDDEDDDEDN